MAACSCTGARKVVLSVIVPAYNAEATIERAIASALAWDGDDMELIVVDDGSTDGTPKLLNALATADLRLRVIHQANAGRSVARNAGVAAAQGEWLMFLDADDFLLSDAFPAVREAMEGDEELVMFTCARSDHEGAAWKLDVGHVDAETVPDARLAVSVLRDFVVGAGVDAPAAAALLSRYTEKSVWAKLYRRSIVERIVDCLGGVGPFTPFLRFAEDMLMNLCYLAAMERESLLASGRTLYFYDLGQSGTWVLTRPQDVLDMFGFRDAVNQLIGCGLVAAEERDGLMTYRMADHVRRMGNLRFSQLAEARCPWKRVVADSDLRECLAKIDFSGVRDSMHFGVPCWLLTNEFVGLALVYSWAFSCAWGVVKRLVRVVHGGNSQGTAMLPAPAAPPGRSHTSHV